MPSKTLDTLVTDIYQVLDKLNEGEKITQELEPYLDRCLNDIRDAILHWATPQPRDGRLRMSNIGQPARKLWMAQRYEGERHDPPYVQLKFLYGHILEQVLLMLVSAAGHTVTDMQCEVELDGIMGSMDSRIDGEVVDIKTASPFGFKKFKEGTLNEDDPFGYITQLASYEASGKTAEGGFLAIDKVTGEIALYRPDDMDKPNVSRRISELKEVMGVDTAPELCYNPVPDGKSGNMMLHRQCTYCEFKNECFKDVNEGQGLRVFQYANGKRYLTHVEKEPKVDEVR